MLRYDPAWLLECYRDERPARPGLPYTDLDACGRFHIVKLAEPFHLQSVLDMEPDLPFNEPVVRLAGYDAATRTLTVQKCMYSDGLKSNYAMEQLRELFQAEYGHRLPPLSDARLSNGIGTAVVVFTPAGPYLPRRARGQAVFPAGYHCTASGEAVWTAGAAGFDEIFTANIHRELEEEVGLAPADLDWVRPVAFCREFLRGGKPQFFFAGFTNLSAEELGRRRRAAIARQIAAGRQEVEDDVAVDLTDLTMEAAANLAFC
jgi:hypothetical protein